MAVAHQISRKVQIIPALGIFLKTNRNQTIIIMENGHGPDNQLIATHPPANATP